MAEDLPVPLEGIRRIAILGTGLIGSSLGLALRRAGFEGNIFGWDREPATLKQSRSLGAVDPAPADPTADDPFIYAMAADLIVLAGPVFAIAEWLDQLAPVLAPSQMVTDVGSVKSFLVDRARPIYNGPKQPAYLPGHPMAGKEYAGCFHAEGTLFSGAAWLFTTDSAWGKEGEGAATGIWAHPLAGEWRGWVKRVGARPVDLTPERHDLLCAWISHLPQLAATALSAVLDHAFRTTFAGEPELHGGLQSLGGRALREMTRLGASPYSMWRDITHVNAPAIAAALLALEQELTHIRENLKTPELREAFDQANAFRVASVSKP